MRSIVKGLFSFVIIGAVTGCGTAVNHTSAASGGSSSNTYVSNTSGSDNTTTSSASFRPLPSNAQKVVIMKNSSKITISNAAKVRALVTAFNQAAEGKHPSIHCNAMSQDNYRITFVYAGKGTRVFTNEGGACRPMVDSESGLKFPSSTLLNKLHN